MKYNIYDYLKKNLENNSLKIKNPYLDELQNIFEKSDSKKNCIKAFMEHRRTLTEKYCFSIPWTAVLDTILQYCPITEIGAGTGYYSYCLKQAGADVEAYDIFTPDDNDNPYDFMNSNFWFDDTWMLVLNGDETAAKACSKRSLFLCWPPPGSKMAYNCLNYFREAGGKFLIYIGDPVSSAEESFFEEIFKFKLEYEFYIPSWTNINEKLMIFNLKEKNGT